MLKDVRVRSLDLDFHEISWVFAHEKGDILDFTFQVFRSESVGGPYVAISPVMLDRYLFIDNQLPTGNQWRVLYYKIRVTQRATGKYIESDPKAHEPEPDLIALETRRHMQLIFREHSGRQCYALPVRTFGPRCVCWNPQLKQRTRSRCATCFDTSYIGGYMSPMEVWISIDPSTKATQSVTPGSTQAVDTTARMGYFPPLKPDDVIVELENKRWTVVKVSQVEHGRAAVYQELTLHSVPLGDIEFTVPLKLDTALRDLWGSPERNFSNPQNLEAVGFPRPPG